ncbi:MAG: hypothetical protein DRG37_04610 [Deltaproteobacteria bacterium]|nr:MAG: hypothetical protein DRG37_04610 [Deltaproteobacteria bacterium]
MSDIVTLLTDFGLKDAYVAQVKARIISEHPDVRIVDITHDIPPFAVISGAWLVYTTFSWFPKGSVHLAVVDPGVGTDRAIIGLKKDGHIFVGPDNGIFSFLFPAEEAREIIWRPEGPISPTFHARDIFAPAVSRILSGVSLESMGPPMKSPFLLDVSRSMIVHIDRFGNVVTNIDASYLKKGCMIEVGDRSVSLVVNTFSDIPEGDIALVKGSSGTVEIVSNQRHAADILGAKLGLPLRLICP